MLQTGKSRRSSVPRAAVHPASEYGPVHFSAAPNDGCRRRTWQARAKNKDTLPEVRSRSEDVQAQREPQGFFLRLFHSGQSDSSPDGDRKRW